MMQGLDAEIVAKIVAENVISILKHRPGGCSVSQASHEAVRAGLMRELLTVMPTTSSDALAAACTRALDGLPSTSKRRPWVEAVDPVGGGVTMREGKRVNAFEAHSGIKWL